MTSRTHTLDCDSQQARRLGEAISAYARAAYPPGGSDCAQVAREALLTIAGQCDAHGGGELALRRRQIPLIRAAVNWYFSADGPGAVESTEAWDRLLRRLDN